MPRQALIAAASCAPSTSRQRACCCRARQTSRPPTRKIDKKELQPGDLVFFNTMRRAFSHVGIYVGDGKFIHSPRSGEVRVEDMHQSYWQRRFDGARRVTPLAPPPRQPRPHPNAASFGQPTQGRITVTVSVLRIGPPVSLTGRPVGCQHFAGLRHVCLVACTGLASHAFLACACARHSSSPIFEAAPLRGWRCGSAAGALYPGCRRSQLIRVPATPGPATLPSASTCHMAAYRCIPCD